MPTFVIIMEKPGQPAHSTTLYTSDMHASATVEGWIAGGWVIVGATRDLRAWEWRAETPPEA
jgi:hypothetical protein